MDGAVGKAVVSAWWRVARFGNWKIENISCFVAEALAHVRNLVHRAIESHLCDTERGEKAGGVKPPLRWDFDPFGTAKAVPFPINVNVKITGSSNTGRW